MTEKDAVKYISFSSPTASSLTRPLVCSHRRGYSSRYARRSSLQTLWRVFSTDRPRGPATYFAAFSFSSFWRIPRLHHPQYRVIIEIASAAHPCACLPYSARAAASGRIGESSVPRRLSESRPRIKWSTSSPSVAPAGSAAESSSSDSSESDLLAVFVVDTRAHRASSIVHKKQVSARSFISQAAPPWQAVSAPDRSTGRWGAGARTQYP